MSNDKQIRYCGHCGAELFGGAKFCGVCGKSSVIDEPVTQPYGYQPRVVTPTVNQNIIRTPLIPTLVEVISNPLKGMERATLSPNWKSPFTIILGIGILSVISLIITFSKITVILTEAFKNAFISEIMMSSSDVLELDGSLITLTLYFTALLEPILSWLIGSVILWILLSIATSSYVHPSRRSLKMSANLVGWSSVPQMFLGLLEIVNSALFVPAGTIQLNVVDDYYGLLYISTQLDDLLLIAYLGVLLWSGFILYNGLKHISTAKNHPMIITVLFMAISFFFI